MTETGTPGSARELRLRLTSARATALVRARYAMSRDDRAAFAEIADHIKRSLEIIGPSPMPRAHVRAAPWAKREAEERAE